MGAGIRGGFRGIGETGFESENEPPNRDGSEEMGGADEDFGI